MSLDVIILKKMMTETSAEIDGIFSQPTGVGLYDCHIEGLNFSSIQKLRVTTDQAAGTYAIAMVEAIIGNVNHLSKTGN